MKATKIAIPALSVSPFAEFDEVEAYPLGKEERKYLEDRETIIEAGRVTFLEVGRALIEIRDYKGGLLYRRYGGWEQYCKERWEFGLSYAYRLIHAAEVATQISPRGENDEKRVPTSEKQLRDLSRLARPEDIRKAWTEASKEAGVREVTSTLVRKAVQRLIREGAKQRTAPRVPKRAGPKRVGLGVRHIKAIRGQLAEIRKAASGASAEGKIADAVAQIEALLPESYVYPRLVPVSVHTPKVPNRRSEGFCGV